MRWSPFICSLIAAEIAGNWRMLQINCKLVQNIHKKLYKFYLRTFWSLVPDRALGCVPIQWRDFPNVYNSCAVWWFVWQLGHNVFYTRHQHPFCLWRIKTILKRRKLPKYYKQNCGTIHSDKFRLLLKKWTGYSLTLILQSNI